MIIYRNKINNNYEYKDEKGNIIKNNEILEYIKDLVIPPAYENVEIYYHNGKTPKILYHGIDSKGRPQFIYSQKWSESQREIKLCNLIDFGKAYSTIMNDIHNFLKPQKWTENKIISLILLIISMCYFRIGNKKYCDLYCSHGISTITANHIDFLDIHARIHFIGKKGVHNECIIEDPLVIKLLKELCELHKTGPIFRYSSEGDYNIIKHTEINNWLKTYNPNFTSKMFRTFDSNIILINTLDQLPFEDKPSKRKKAVVQALKQVALKVHNTPTISKKSYCDIDLIDLYLLHPKKYKSKFMNGKDTKTNFINYLKDKCGVEN